MTVEKVSFYARDPDVCTSDLEDERPKQHSGQERRKQHRRDQPERRTEVRFDLNNSDRRRLEGRREDDITPKFW